MWQICRLFFDEKKPLFLRLISINHWKYKQNLCQNKYMSSNWSCGLVECSFVNLIERVSKKLTSFSWMSGNDGRKTFLTEKVFTTNCCNGQTDSSFDDTTEKFSSESQEKIRSSVKDEQKKNLFEEKSLQQISFTSGRQFWQNCYLFSDRNTVIFSFNLPESWKKHTKKFKTDVCLQNDPSDS